MGGGVGREKKKAGILLISLEVWVYDAGTWLRTPAKPVVLVKCFHIRIK